MSNAHVCNVCHGPDAYWGFGPPLTGVQVWACEMHLSQTESMLAKTSATPRNVKPTEQGRLI